MAKKYYVVWSGKKSGIFDNWDDCKAQVHGVKGAIYKSYNSLEQAKAAFADETAKKNASWQSRGAKISSAGAGAAGGSKPMSAEIMQNALSVDAACSGNPGKMEYRGVWVASREECFHSPVYAAATNNIGEFLAIVHALALFKKKGVDLPIYSDSENALLWVKMKKCRTRLQKTSANEVVFERIAAAEKWLAENSYPNQLIKWNTKAWGEIPADFGRK